MDDDLSFGKTLRGFEVGQEMFGRYRLLRILGRGGMGVVWLARDGRLDRDVALKFLPDSIRIDAESISDLKKETRRSLDLTHTHIVRIYDFVEDERTAAIAMEYIAGETLSSLKVKQPGGCFDAGQIEAWVGQVLDALEYAHGKAKIVHRDLKPANIMIAADGDAKVCDFGIARSISETVSRLSVSGAGSSGTLVYMSPQQALGMPPCAGDDIYAFGATLYDLLTGKPPFYSGDIITQVREIEPQPMAERRAQLGAEGKSPIPAQWEAVVRACLAKDPSARPRSVAELRASFKGVSAPVSTGAFSGSDFKWVLPVALAGVAILVSVAGLWWWRGSRAADAVAPTNPVVQAPAAQRPVAEEKKPDPSVLYARYLETNKSSPIEAFPLLKQASDLGFAAAQFDLAKKMCSGEGVAKDWAAGLELCKKAAEQGLPDAQVALGGCYSRGEGIAKNFDEAVKWFRKAADQGSAVGQYNLGLCYANGLGVEKNMETAMQWLHKAAEQGWADAQNMLGWRYMMGQGVAEDIGAGLVWMRKAADQGVASAQHAIGACYMDGVGVPKDASEGVRWYRKAAEQGLSESQYALGQCYAKGVGVEKNEAEAATWYSKAAGQGHAGAQCSLGEAYHYGKGVGKDRSEAFAWYRKAAEQGHAEGQYNIGFCYEFGWGAPMDNAQAFVWYRKAAEQGHAEAMHSVGAAYAGGNGVGQDPAEAVQWYRKAAERGHPKSQFILGICYALGQGGMPKDLGKAIALFKQAAAQGDPEAKEALQKIEEEQRASQPAAQQQKAVPKQPKRAQGPAVPAAVQAKADAAIQALKTKKQQDPSYNVPRYISVNVPPNTPGESASGMIIFEVSTGLPVPADKLGQ